jgi:hypothetical protein
MRADDNRLNEEVGHTDASVVVAGWLRQEEES